METLSSACTGWGQGHIFSITSTKRRQTNKNDGQTAIMKVAGKVHDDIFHYLHEAGADLNIKFIQFIQ